MFFAVILNWPLYLWPIYIIPSFTKCLTFVNIWWMAIYLAIRLVDWLKRTVVILYWPIVPPDAQEHSRRKNFAPTTSWNCVSAWHECNNWQLSHKMPSSIEEALNNLAQMLIFISFSIRIIDFSIVCCAALDQHRVLLSMILKWLQNVFTARVSFDP